jgi:hypothetical protein
MPAYFEPPRWSKEEADTRFRRNEEVKKLLIGVQSNRSCLCWEMFLFDSYLKYICTRYCLICMSTKRDT